MSSSWRVLVIPGGKGIRRPFFQELEDLVARIIIPARGVIFRREQNIAFGISIPGFDPWVREDPLEKEMGTHSSILVWDISWTEEPGGL